MMTTEHRERSNALSAEDLRSHLYNKFREKGIVNDIRSQFRSRLLTELHSISSRREIQSDCATSTGEENALLIRITNWFVAQHLQTSKYYSTLSVFASESKSFSESEDIIALKDVLNLLQIHPDTKLHRSIMEAKEKQSHSSILTLMLHLMGVELEFHKKDSLQWQEDQSVQTEIDSKPFSFQQKLQEVEDLYMLKKGIQRIEDEKSFEAHLLRYQQQLQEKIEKETKEEMRAFREKELLKIKLEIQEKSLKENQSYRRKLEQEYQEKFAALVKKEKKDLEDMNVLKENFEKEIYLQRQEILDQLDIARQKEISAQKLKEKLEDETTLEKDKLKLYEQKLKMMEEKLLQEEHHLNSKVKAMVSKERLQEQMEFNRKLQEVEEEKAKFSVLNDQVENEKLIIDQLKLEHSSSIKQTEDLHQKLNECQTSESKLRMEKAELMEMLQDLPMINSLKSECNSSTAAISKLKQMLEETEKERNSYKLQLTEMRSLMELPSPEVLQVKCEIEKLRDAHHLDRAVWDEHRIRLENQLRAEHHQNQVLSQRIESYSQSEKELQDRIYELTNQLQQLHKYLQKLAVPGKIDHKDLLTETTVNDQNTFYDTTLNPNTVPLELQLQGNQRNILSPVPTIKPVAPVNSPAEDMGFLHQSRNRVLSWQKEAEYLEKYYESFQTQTEDGVKPLSESYLTSSVDFKTNSKSQPRFHLKKNYNKTRLSFNIDSNEAADSSLNEFTSLKKPFTKLNFPEQPSAFITQKKTYQSLPQADTFTWDFSYKTLGMPTTSEHAEEKYGNSKILSMANETQDILHSTLLIDNEDLPSHKEFKDRTQDSNDSTLVSETLVKFNNLDNNKKITLPSVVMGLDESDLFQQSQSKLQGLPFDIAMSSEVHEKISTGITKELHTPERSSKTAVTNSSSREDLRHQMITDNNSAMENDDGQENLASLHKQELFTVRESVNEKKTAQILPSSANENSSLLENVGDILPPKIDLEAQWKMKKQIAVVNDDDVIPDSFAKALSGFNKQGEEELNQISSLQKNHVGTDTAKKDEVKSVTLPEQSLSEADKDKRTKSDFVISNPDISPDHSENFSAGTCNPSSEDDW